jgi:general secretion pathway protein B
LLPLAAFVLLLNIVLWLWWAKPWQGDMALPTAKVEVVVPVSQPEPIVSQVMESPMPQAPPMPDERPRVAENMNMPQNAVVLEATEEKTAPVAEPTWAMEKEEIDSPVYPEVDEPAAQTALPYEETDGTEEAVAAAPEGATEVAGVLSQDELPEHIQQALPQLRISLHFFSNKPEARLVRINDRHLHEGDMVASELRLLEITESGVILSFRGYQFLVNKL